MSQHDNDSTHLDRLRVSDQNAELITSNSACPQCTPALSGMTTFGRLTNGFPGCISGIFAPGQAKKDGNDGCQYKTLGFAGEPLDRRPESNGNVMDGTGRCNHHHDYEYDDIDDAVDCENPNERATQTADHDREQSNRIARELAMEAVYFAAGTPTKKSMCSSKYSKVMTRTVREISKRHDILFVNIINRFRITRTNGKDAFIAIADEMFQDRQMNWGRLVTVYALGANFARYSAENNMPDYVEEIGGYLGDYVAERLGQWIVSNGGWDAFCEFFPEKQTIEDKLWKGLLYTFTGLGVLAGIVAVR